MDIKVGTDIIEVNRIKDSIESTDEKFIERVFTQKEIEYCENTNQMRFQHYAARFAAKEAVFKAVASLFDSKFELSWQNIEITNLDDGKPIVTFIGIDESITNQISSIDLSISHIKEYAMAMTAVILK